MQYTNHTKNWTKNKSLLISLYCIFKEIENEELMKVKSIFCFNMKIL